MILGQIDFPDELIASIAQGTCVVFAGAGVSKGQPANLPLFAELAKCLMGEVPPSGEPLDRFLGKAGNRQQLVEKTIAIVRTSPKHNPLHEYIVRLFQRLDLLRVVTTNYDQHFESAARQCFGSEPQALHAPALPLGKSFSGIVHVHGSIQHPDGMVLTDVDFGHAYLTEGWARRFLVELFQHWDVLFVGYSHDDIIMNYLARALPPSSRKRFALDRGLGKTTEWRSRDIQVIPFGKGDDVQEFSLQSDALRELATYLGRSAIDWARNMAQRVKEGPPQDKAVQSQLAHALKRPLECRIFLEQHPDSSWVSWLDNQGLLHGLFKDSAGDECSGQISRWFSHEILHARPQAVLNWMMDKGQISTVLWHELAHGILSIPAEVDATVMCQILGTLVGWTPSNVNGMHMRWISETAAKLKMIEVVIELFKLSCVSVPSFEQRPRWRNDQPVQEPDIVPLLRYDHHHLQEIIDDIRPMLGACALRLFPVVCDALIQRYTIQSRWGAVGHVFDADCYGRAAIERHEQDRFTDACDPLINISRDILNWMSGNAADQLQTWISSSLRAPTPLIRRLAVYGLTICPKQDPDETLRTIADSVVPDKWCRHEAFMAIKSHYGPASTEARRHLIEEIRKSITFDPQKPDENAAFYHYQWLKFIATHHPSCQLAADECRIVNSAFPTVIMREYPDLTHWTTSGRGGDTTPTSGVELLGMNSAEVIAHERARREDQSPRYDFDSYYDSITKAAEQDIEWANRLMNALLVDDTRSDRFCDAVLRSYAKHLSHPDTFPAAMQILEDPRLHLKNGELTCSMMQRLVEKDPPSHAITALPRLDALASVLWSIAKIENLARPQPKDWVRAAINSSAGSLTECVLSSLSKQCRVEDGVSPPAIPDVLRVLLLDMLADPSVNGGMCRTLIAAQTGYFYWLNKDLTNTHILPMFISETALVRSQAWQGFLTWGSLNPVLAQSMRSAFEMQIVGDYGILGNDKLRFAEYLVLAGALISDQCAKDWTLHPGVQADRDLSHAVARQTIGFLRDAPSDILTRHWSGWVFPFWKARTEGNPRPLDEHEVAIYLDGLDEIEAVIDEAATLFDRITPVRLESVHILHGIHTSGIDARKPIAAAKILAYVLSCDSRPWCYYGADDILKTVVPLLLDPEHKRRIVNLAIQRSAITSSDGMALLPLA